MSAIFWFEIPVQDINRAAAFYSRLLEGDLKVEDYTETQGSWMAMLPGRGGNGGALVEHRNEHYVPSHDGSLLYLSVDGPVEDALARVKDAGGKVLLDKTSLGEWGYTAWIEDTEGNRVGLHSME